MVQWKIMQWRGCNGQMEASVISLPAVFVRVLKIQGYLSYSELESKQ